MRVLLMSMPDTTPYIAKREWEAPSLGIASIAGNLGLPFGAPSESTGRTSWDCPR
jgi:hypothetical protein